MEASRPRRFALLRPAPLRKRLWQLGVAMAVFLIAVVGTNAFLSPAKSLTMRAVGHDFLAFYAAGTFVHEGRAGELYNLDSIRAFEHQIIDRYHLDLGEKDSVPPGPRERDLVGPFWNPPFYAWLFVPFAMMPYPTAVATWIGVNLLCFAIACWLLVKMLPLAAESSGLPLIAYPINSHRGERFSVTHTFLSIPSRPTSTFGGWRTALLVPLLICISMPFIQAVMHGQSTPMSLLLLAAIVTLWRQKNAVAAGVVVGLLFYKPQLAAVATILLTVSLGTRVLIGLSFTVGMFVLITGSTLPGTAGEWLDGLPANLKYLQVDHTYLWERHVTLKAFWRLLLQGRGPGETSMLTSALTALCSVGLLGGLFAVVQRNRKHVIDNPWVGPTAAQDRDKLIAAGLFAMPLLMPFYFDYDLLLMAVPITLFAADQMRQDGKRSALDRTIVFAIATLYPITILNPLFGGKLLVNGTVINLAIIATLLTIRALRPQLSLVDLAMGERIIERPRPMRRAA